MRSFEHDLRDADRKVINALREEDAAAERYGLMRRATTEGIPHAADEDRRLQLLTEARQAFAGARNATNVALEARARVIDDRMQDHIVRLLRHQRTTPVSLSRN